MANLSKVSIHGIFFGGFWRSSEDRLVLAGGGGRGGYQIGVWKYLKEIGLDKKIAVISGTSVGGLNAALMVAADYEVAERIWTQEIEGKILDRKSLNGRRLALFSREGLIDIMDCFVDLEKIRTSNTQVYVTCSDVKGLTEKAFKLNEYEVPKIKEMLCATSAIPIAFPYEKIHGKKYVDGGFFDNIPLKPLLDEQCTHALIVNLRDKHENYEGYDIETFVLHPSADLGGVGNGMMDFSLERALKRIELGYNDCKNIHDWKIKLLQEDTMAEEMRRGREIQGMQPNQVFLETLRLISADPSQVGRIQCKMNADGSTLGGKVLWETLGTYGGWVFQQHKLTRHVRLLDPMHNRRAWGSFEKMLNICRQFLVQECKRNAELTERTPSRQDAASIAGRLEQLKGLRERNLIDEDAYNLKKQEILREL